MGLSGGTQNCQIRDGSVEKKLTSLRNVCAAFVAPTCSKYSYTYKANLK